MRLIILIVLAALALPALAVDASSGSNLHLFTPPVGDVSVDFLTRIFGAGKDGVGLGGEDTMLGAALAIFNEAVLLLAMLFVIYTSVTGIVNSAHDGEVLGKKMSEIWVPIRTVVGTGLLLPLSSGFSLIQMAILWLALQGVGVADGVWTAALGQLAKTGTMGSVSIPSARPLAANILRASVCAAAMNKQFEGSGRAERIEVVKSLADKQLRNAYYGTTTYRWQSTMRSAGSPASCGSLEWADSTQYELTEDMTHAARGAVYGAHKLAVEALILSLEPVAQQIVSGQRPPAVIVDAAAAAYERIIADAAAESVKKSPDIARLSFIKHAKTGGWIQVGSWFNHMVKLNDTIQATANQVPTFKPIAIENLETSEVLQNYHDALAFTDAYLVDRSAAGRDSYQSDLENSSSIRTMDDVWRLLSIPVVSAMQGITKNIAGANTSGLTQLAETGNSIINMGVVIKASWFTIMGFAKSKLSGWTAGLVFDVGAALGTVSGMVEFVSSALWAVGGLLAYGLVSLPALWWLGGCIRWLASVAEGVLAAPLMAAMHLHPGGDELVGRAGPGYMLILSMVVAPSLLVLGFIIAAMMTSVACELANMLWLGMVPGASSGVVGLLSAVAWLCVYLLFQITAVHGSLALINAVPDGVMRWFGSQAGAQNVGVQQVEKSGGKMETTTEKVGTAAVGKASSGGDFKPGGKAGGEPRGGNGFTNADHMPGN